MVNHVMSRRSLLKGGGAALAGLSTVHVAGPAYAFPGDRDEVLVPWVDRQLFSPPPVHAARLGAARRFVDHRRTTSSSSSSTTTFRTRRETWRLGITGLVARPQSLRLADLKPPARVASRPSRWNAPAITASRTSRGPSATRAGRARRWRRFCTRRASTGRPPRWCSTEPTRARLMIRDNPGVLRPASRRPDAGTPDPANPGQFFLTINEQFSRSMSVEEALDPDNLLALRDERRPVARRRTGSRCA